MFPSYEIIQITGTLSGRGHFSILITGAFLLVSLSAMPCEKCVKCLLRLTLGFCSPIRTDRFRTCRWSPKGAGQGPNPCDTDTRNDWPAKRLGL